MTSRNVVRLGVILVVGLGLAVVGGSRLGKLYGAHQREAQGKPVEEGLQEYLEKHVEGIAVGQSFPYMVVWSVDGSQAHEVRELLPKGGVIFFFDPGCESCIEAVQVLHDVLSDLGANAKPALIVTGPNPEPLIKKLEEGGRRLPLYVDAEQSLQVQHNVLVTRAFFELDSAGVVKRFGALGLESRGYVDILTKLYDHGGRRSLNELTIPRAARP